MFNSFIDAVSDGQKKVVELAVTDKKVATEITKLIDTQTKFYKTMTETTVTLAQTMVANAPKFPFAGAK